MFDRLKSFFDDLTGAGQERGFAPDDYRVAAAALLIHMANADGHVAPQEQRRLRKILEERFELDPAAARATLETARRFLIDQGVDPAKIQLAGYDAGGDPTAPVVVGYARYTAQGPDCSQAWPNMTATMNNREYENFGCAVTANMAAMIDNPGDVLQPRTMTPADAGRRATVLGRYRAGEVTSSAADAQANGAVSRAVD